MDGIPKNIFHFKKELTNILSAFVHYRPDMRYVKNMAFLAGTLLFYCSEFDTFNCFLNLVHDFHFPILFEGVLADFKLRVDKFDGYFKEHLPELFGHFEGLEIKTAYFLSDWLLSLFTKCLDFQVASRVWDNFLIEGEVFAFKTGIAFLAYHQQQFLQSTHAEIKNILRNGNTQEESIFSAMSLHLKKSDILMQSKESFSLLE
jgi:cytohesin/brefeldin A-inhibited guanine nucleotide-exchange protein